MPSLHFSRHLFLLVFKVYHLKKVMCVFLRVAQFLAGIGSVRLAEIGILYFTAYTCPEHAGYNDHITAKEKDASISVICYSRPPETSISQCMVIVTNYELIENLQTHFFMYGVQKLFLVLVAVII